MACKWGRRLLTLASATACVVGVVYLLKGKNDCKKDEEFSDEFEDDDFDLDDDFDTPSDREYVSLTPNGSDTEKSEQITEEEQ